MCGIFGLIGQRSADDIKAANATIAHRGPDADGFWFDSKNKVSLAHRRLAILDLSEAGAQPMTSRSGRYVTCYNGELYNYKELIQKLAPVTYRGYSDTEVLLECLDQWGLEKTLENIEGMYAIALWDTQDKKLILVRDRLGEKPLYFGTVDGNFVFASELKPITHLFKDKLQLDSSSVADFFRRSCIAGDKSIFQQIRKLRAGHFMVVSTDGNGTPKVSSPKSYWSLKQIPLGTIEISESDAITRVERELSTAIAQQMISDVPLGAFLSGGIDSSLVVALMQAQSQKKIKTFSIGFDIKDYDEAPHAKKVAQHLGTDHQELYVSEKELIAQVPKLSSIYDEPFADSSQIPTILVSQMARKQVTVALSGDGGDELFAGYNRHGFAHQRWPTLESIPAPLRQLLGTGIHALPQSAWRSLFSVVSPNTSQPYEKIYKLAQALEAGSLKELYKSVSTHWQDQSPLLAKGQPLSDEDWDVQSALEMTVADASWYMPDDVLVKVDRASMSQSLETRAPFLNRQVVETAFGLPMDLKIRDGQSKWILRQILYKHVPQALIERPKMGFGVPMDAWLRHELKDWAWSLLSPDALKDQSVLDAKVVLQKWEEHQKGTRNWFTELWDVLMFQAWRKQFRV